MYSVAQFAKQVGVSVKTLQRWDREGRLKAKRTLSGRRYYDEADLATALNLPQRPAIRRTVAYCRVSSPAQRPDLQNQRAALESYAVSKQLVVDEWIMEIGGGLNFERKRFLRLVDAIVEGEVLRLLIAHQDRLEREEDMRVELVRQPVGEDRMPPHRALPRCLRQVRSRQWVRQARSISWSPSAVKRSGRRSRVAAR